MSNEGDNQVMLSHMRINNTNIGGLKTSFVALQERMAVIEKALEDQKKLTVMMQNELMIFKQQTVAMLNR